jgi:hypothetical protein
MKRAVAAVLLAAVAIPVALAACASPASRYPDSDRISGATSRALKEDVRMAGSAFPVWRLQVEEVAPPGSSGSDGAMVGARVTWRTLFGIQYGETVVEAGPTFRTSFDAIRYFGAALGFVMIEVLLVGLGLLLVLDVGGNTNPSTRRR